jgi:hypothetical protein
VRAQSHFGCAGDLDEDKAVAIEGVRDGVEVIVTLGFRQSLWDPLTVEEVAHDPVGDRPVVAAVDAVMVRAQPNVSPGMESTRGT